MIFISFLAFSSLLIPAFSQEETTNVQASAAPCPADSQTIGYTAIQDINVDMLAELDRIAAGGDPPAADTLEFILCPQTEFDATAPLVPMLSGASILCGTDGKRENLCTFTGGTEQVLIDEPTDPDYELETVTIQGVTFTQFTGSAISGDASETTRLSLFDNQFSVSCFDGLITIYVESRLDSSSHCLLTYF